VKPHISVVEDDPDISRLVRHHLEAPDSPSNFTHRQAILADPSAQRPTLFIPDIMVPGRTGSNFAGRFRRPNPSL